jgi:hypothetical protein
MPGFYRANLLHTNLPGGARNIFVIHGAHAELLSQHKLIKTVPNPVPP